MAINSIFDWHFYLYLYVINIMQNTAKFNQEMEADQRLSSVAGDPSRLAPQFVFSASFCCVDSWIFFCLFWECC